MEEILSNPWVIEICAGIIVTVVGGLILHFLVRGANLEFYDGCAPRILRFLFREAVMLAVLGFVFLMASNMRELFGAVFIYVLVGLAILGTLANLIWLLTGHDYFDGIF